MTDVYDAVGVPDEVFDALDDETAEERHDRAFMAFSHLPRKHSRGWAVRLAAITDISPHTLKRWRKQHQWDIRFAGEMARLNPDMEKLGQALLWSGMGRVADRLLDIVDFGADRDANTAIKTWSEMTGMTVRKPAQSAQINQSIHIDVGEVREYKAMSAEELFRQVKDRTQSQLDDTLMLRTGKGKTP